MNFQQLFPCRRWVKMILPILPLMFALLLMVIYPAAADSAMRYVDSAGGNDSGDCLDPDNPCQTINYAIGQSGDGDTIAITGGTYAENVKLKDGLARTIRGGYTIVDGAWLPAGPEPTVIDGGDVDSTVEVRDHTDTTFQWLTVTGGLGLDDPTFGNGCGGFKIQSSNVEMANLVIEGNSAGTGDGGAVCIAGDDGRAALNVYDTFIRDNQANGHGGAFALFNSDTMVVNGVITGNGSNSNIANVALLNMDDKLTLINTTVFNNNPAGDQAIHVFDGEVTVKNSIMWDNALNFQADPPCPTCFDISYSNIQGFSGGMNNIDEIPKFRDATNEDFRLQWDSPCVNAGTAAGAPDFDITGHLRDDMPDMGAYEFYWQTIYLPVILHE